MGFGYDGDGDPTTYKGQALTFDPEDRLTQCGSAQQGGYSADGLRAWKRSSSGSRAYFLHDGDRPVCEVSADGVLPATNTFGADGLISRRAGGASAFYAFDERGCVAQRLSSAGAVQSSELYDAYGSRAGTAGQANPWGYMGQWGYYTDAETGLILCTDSFYDPALGRFLTRAPIGYDGGLNLYGYTGNNPVNQIDPDGT